MNAIAPGWITVDGHATAIPGFNLKQAAEDAQNKVPAGSLWSSPRRCQNGGISVFRRRRVYYRADHGRRRRHYLAHVADLRFPNGIYGSLRARLYAGTLGRGLWHNPSRLEANLSLLNSILTTVQRVPHISLRFSNEMWETTAANFRFGRLEVADRDPRIPHLANKRARSAPSGPCEGEIPRQAVECRSHADALGPPTPKQDLCSLMPTLRRHRAELVNPENPR